jgi:hypothetical protein
MVESSRDVYDIDQFSAGNFWLCVSLCLTTERDVLILVPRQRFVKLVN